MANLYKLCLSNTPLNKSKFHGYWNTYESVPLMLMDNIHSNPFYDVDAASEYLLMTKDGIRPQSEQDEMIINIGSGLIKKCPEKLIERKLAGMKGLVN